MKKSIIALMGVFALFACSDEAVQDAEKQSENPMNGISSFDDGGNSEYMSPWDIWLRNDGGFRPSYTIINGGGSSPYQLHVTAYIGLAYFDGIDDGVFYDISEPPTNPGDPGKLIADMRFGGYPNLYNNNGNHEIGGLIESTTVVMDGTTHEDCEVSIGSLVDHCPITGVALGNGWNPQGRYFDIGGNASGVEIDLLKEYGKVFFYRVEVYDQNNNLVLPSEYLQVENIGIANSVQNWIPTGISANAPGGSPTALYYQNAGNPAGTVYAPGGTGWISDSREVDFQTAYQHSYPLGAGAISLKMVYGNTYWQGSGLFLTIEF